MENTRMPALFIGHGSPMNAIEDNEFSRAWQETAKLLPVPEAILCISAHWETHGTHIGDMQSPRTIHDFYGFPSPLFAMQYPAPGSPQLAQRVMNLVGDRTVQADESWGLDHGTWSVLCRMYPQADIPVVQLSLDRDLSPEEHYSLGRQLGQLRREGVLVMGSGNMVHNLRIMIWEDTAFDWAVEYDSMLEQWILEDDHDAIIHYERHGEAALLAVNSREHYLPLLYSLAVKEKDEPVSFFTERIWGGSLSMRCVRIG